VPRKRWTAYGVAVAGLSGSGTGVGSGVAVGTGVGVGVGGTPGVGGGGCVAKIPSGSRSCRYISQCPSGKQTHSHLSGKQRSRCCGFAASTAGVQAAASFSASVIVLPSQSQQLSGAGVALGKQSTDDVSGSKHDSGTGVTTGSTTTAGLGSSVGFGSCAENTATGSSVAMARTTLTAKSGRMRFISIYASHHCGDHSVIFEQCVSSSGFECRKI
jgi:hypothetical protein